MKFDDDAKLDTGQIDDQRGNSRRGGGGFGGGGLGGMSRGGLPFPVGGKGKGGGAALIIMLLLFVLPKLLGGGGSGGDTGLGGLVKGQRIGTSAAGSNTDIAQKCQTGADANKYADCRIVGVVNSVQAYWKDVFSRQGETYPYAPTNFFTGEVQTACGPATSAVGPFYCPGDSEIYIDLDFYDELRTKFNAEGGPFAEAYVIAHEYGHHIQNLTGQSEAVQKSGDRSGPTSGSVRLELQADCYAGTWAHNATSGPNPLIVELTDEDIRLGLDAAAAVGDDRIQKEFQGRVTPETWTHGSAAQRQKWFMVGFKSGEPTDCDTFNTNNL